MYTYTYTYYIYISYEYIVYAQAPYVYLYMLASVCMRINVVVHRKIEKPAYIHVTTGIRIYEVLGGSFVIIEFGLMLGALHWCESNTVILQCMYYVYDNKYTCTIYGQYYVWYACDMDVCMRCVCECVPVLFCAILYTVVQFVY